jgi:hypothetical protein
MDIDIFDMGPKGFFEMAADARHKPQCCIKKMKKISQTIKSVEFKMDFSLVSGFHQ